MDPTENAIEENRRLRRTMRDLVALSTLPAVWTGLPPEGIAHSLADALLYTLSVDLIYIRLAGLEGEGAIEVVRSKHRLDAGNDEAVKTALAPFFEEDRKEPPASIPDPFGSETLNVAVTRFGVGDDYGVLVAGSRNANFPNEQDRLLLGVGANQTAIVVQRRRAEEQMRQHQEWLRVTLASIGDAVIATDIQGRVTFLNDVAQQLTGWAQEEAQGQSLETVFVILNEQTRQQSESPVEKVLRDGAVVGPGNHTVLVARDGMERPIDDSAAPILDESGKLIGVVLIFRDVTEQRRTERALWEREQELRLVTDHAPVFLVHCDRDARYRYVNKRYAERLGLTPQDIIGKQIPDVIGEQAYASFRDHVEAALAGRLVDFEIEIPYEKIGPRVMHCSCAPDFGPDGRVRGLVAVLADVTDRKRAEDALRESREHLRAVVETTPACIKTVAADGTLLDMNSAGLAMVDADCPEEVQGRCVYGLVSEEYRDAFQAFNERICRGEKGSMDFDVIGLRGTRRQMETYAAPLRGQDGNFMQLAITLDVSERKKAEQDLKLQARVLESMAEGVSLADENGVIIYTNPAEDQMFGYGRGELVGQHVSLQNTYPPEENQRIVGEIIERLKAEGAWSGEFRNRRKDGSEFTTFARITALETGGKRYFVCVQEDITERKRVDSALADARSRLDAALEAGAIVTWAWDIPNNRLFADNNLARLFNLPPIEAEGGVLENYVRSIHADDIPRVTAALDRSVKSGEDYESDYRIMQADGSVRWVTARGRVERDGSGRPVRMPGVLVDITERKRLEEELRVRVEQLDEADRRKEELLASLRESEEKLRLLADTIPQLAWMARPEGDVFWYNRRWHEYTGTTPEEMEGWGWQSVHDPDVLPEVLERWKASIASGEPFDMVFPLKGADERFRPFLTRVNPLKDEEGRILYWFGTNTDISAIKRMEEALRDADRRKDEFLATLAHELRNPLAPIRNSLQILKMPRVDAETARQTREMMERQVHHLVRLVDDLLDVSRVMRGKIELRRERVELATVVARAVETAKPLIEVQGHVLDLSLPSDSLLLDGDPVRLAQVVGNLLTNSAKYTEANGHIRLTARREGGEAVLSIRDNGIGIAPDMLPHVFELFVQVDHSSTKAQGGLGIGLTLVKNLVEMHGGTVEPHSAGLGQGSEFVVRLPLLVQERQEPVEEGNGKRQPDASSSGHRLLVVDDNKDAAVSLAMLLQLQGHEVRVVHDGISALEVAKAFRPVLIFLDVGMPGMDGLEVARRLRQQPGLGQVVLAALTGWGQQEDRRRTAEAGFNHHLVKPPEAKALEGLIAELNGKME